MTVVMPISNLAQKIIDPSLKVLLDVSGDVSQVTLLPFWNVARDLNGLDANYRAFTSANYQTPAQVTDTRILNIITSVLKEMSINEIASIPGIIEAYLKIGLAVFYIQLGAIIGDTNDPLFTGFMTFGAAQRSMVVKATRYMIERVAGDLPYTTDMAYPTTGNASDVCQDMQCFTAAASRLALKAVSEHFKDMPEAVDWMFPQQIVKFMVDVALRPFFIVMFMASFIPGPWNRIARANTSFYDSRFAQSTIYKSLFQTLFKFGNMNRASNPNAANELFARMSKLNMLLTAKSSAETGEGAMLNMYTQVSALSRQNKDMTFSLDATSEKLRTRRGHAMSMLENREVDRVEMERKKKRMFMWIIAYALSVAVALYLVSAGHHENYLFHVMIVLLVVSLYLIGNAVRDAVQQRFG